MPGWLVERHGRSCVQRSDMAADAAVAGAQQWQWLALLHCCAVLLRMSPEVRAGGVSGGSMMKVMATEPGSKWEAGCHSEAVRCLSQDVVDRWCYTRQCLAWLVDGAFLIRPGTRLI